MQGIGAGNRGMSDGNMHDGKKTGRGEEAGEGALASMPASLAALIRRSDGPAGRPLPPVDQWNPEFCGDLDMRIAADGTWFYLGTPIGRLPLVKLFASVLRKDDDGKTYLVTPVEKIGITVEDAHFQAVEMASDSNPETGGRLTFRTQLGDLVPLDQDHPMRFELEAETGGLKAYIRVRGRLEARLTRALMYDLIALADAGKGPNADQYGIASGNAFFPICSLAELEAFEVHA